MFCYPFVFSPMRRQSRLSCLKNSYVVTNGLQLDKNIILILLLFILSLLDPSKSFAAVCLNSSFSTATGLNAFACGNNNTASGDSAAALGINANASNTNSTALGYGASTTSANQVMIGSSATTYAMPGILSSASAAAQSGSTQFLTTDSQGHLAGSGYGPQDIGNLYGAVGSLSGKINSNQGEARQGIAMAAALAQAPMPSAPGKTTWKLNNAYYKNYAATSLSVAHRLPINMPVAVTAGVSIGLRNSALVSGGMQGEF